MATRLHEYIVYSTDFQAVNSPAFYDCCVHLICTAGSGSFKYNGNTFSIHPDEIAVIAYPRQVTAISASPDMACEFIAAPNQFLHNLLPANNYSIQGGISLFANPIITVSSADAATFRIDLNNIRRRINDIDHLFYTEMMGSLLETMIYDLFDYHSRINDSILTTDRVGYITSRFFALIEAGRPKTRREVSYYADQLHVTPKYLSETIKRVTGEAVSVHINRTAAAIILQYLHDNKLSITQIADEMNFTSVSYFSRFCKKNLGAAPKGLRVNSFSATS